MEFEYIDNIKNPLYSVIMDVLAKSSPAEILEVYRNMGVAKISEDNMAFLMDEVKKLEIDKKLKEEGKLEGILEGRLEGKLEGRLEGKLEGKVEGKRETARNLLQLGVSIDIIIKATGLSEQEIVNLRKEINN
jgi:predicted transposase/invertase (TIGR01784 family)